MTAGRPAAGIRTETVVGIAVAVAVVALAALSLLAPSVPSYDPYAWISWGRELTASDLTFSVFGGPSFKPLPVVFTTVFSLFGGAAPSLWIVVARIGALAALIGAFALGRRLAGVWAGLLAAAGVFLLSNFLLMAWRGTSEPLLIACVLWAVECHLARRRDLAFWLGVGAALIRPEAWPFLGLYAIWLWQTGEGGWGRRISVLAGLALVPLLWFGLPALGGDALVASSNAAHYNGHTGSDPGLTALRRGLGLAVAPAWLLAAVAVALRPRDPRVRWIAGGAAAWLALVVVMTIGGYPGLARFMLPSAALACVLAGAGFVWLLERAGGASRIALGLVLAAVVVGLSAGRAGTLDAQRAVSVRAARVQHQLDQTIAAVGGRRRILACAAGAVATNHTGQTALAWKLRVPLERVKASLVGSGMAFVGPHIAALGAPPKVHVAWRQHRGTLVHLGVWRVVAVVPAGESIARVCPRTVAG